MPPEITALREILSKLKFNHKNNQVLLEEKGEQATLKKVFLSNVSNDYLTLKPDAAQIKIFAKGCGNRQCDYIVLSEYNKQKFALFIDLKSSLRQYPASQQKNDLANDEYGDIVIQFLGSSCLLDFIQSALMNFRNLDIAEYKRRYVILYNKDIPRISHPIDPTRIAPNDSPKNLLIKKIENEGKLDFESLIIPSPKNEPTRF